ncbi:MAG: S-layer homology domain-containing protein [Schwartzia sp.]|nr:S-layer homology domain-containing protein [Schwartzia sp. (in: firmicutes)]
MRKTVVSACAAALLAASASTAFAAANPFEDVPADHWSYDAVAQLAADGVIEGYGDGTYRGGQEITRFEMAQMIARAMTKNASGVDKAMLDKLAAEFADELNSLGVRVAALEKKVDNVTWTGQVRYRYRVEPEIDEHKSTRYTHQYLTLRLEPTMKVNDHWSGHARIDYNSNMNTAANTPLSTPPMTTNKRHEDTDIEYNGMRVERIWAEGDYGKLNIKLGKLPYTSNIDEGMMYDANVAGGQITFGNKVKATITAGRAKRFDGELGIDPDESRNGDQGDTGSYQAIEIYNDRADKWTWGLAYHRWANKDTLKEDTNAEHLNIYEVALGYKFNKNLRMHGAYSWTNDPDFDAPDIHDDPPDNTGNQPIFGHSKRSWSIELDYKKANPADKGSWGAFVAYRSLGHYSTIAPIYDTIYNGRRGTELGVSYVFLKNLMGTVKYFRGQKMPDDNDGKDTMERDSVFFGELNFFF